MTSVSTHEAAHGVAIHILHLAEILRPGGAAITTGGGGFVALDCTVKTDMAALAADINRDDISPCATAIIAARERPDLAPAIIMFMAAGYAATSDTWAGNFGNTITVRRSSDFNTVRVIILDLLGATSFTAENFASEAARDAIDRAISWTAQLPVKDLIDRVAARLDANSTATWTQLEKIFSTADDNGSPDRDSASIAASALTPLAGITAETVEGKAQSSLVEIERAKNPNINER